MIAKEKVENMNGQNKNQYDLFDKDELLALSRLDIENGRLDEALLKLKRVLSEAQPPAKAIAMTARLYAQLGLFDRAELLFRRYVELDPEAVTELFQLGMSLFDGGKIEEAVEVWDKVLNLQSFYPPAIFYKGLVLAQKGEVDAARTQLDELLRKIPTDNLYFSRARDLMQELDNSRVIASQTEEFDTLVAMDKDAYKTIQ